MATRVIQDDNSGSRSLLFSIAIAAMIYLGPRNADGSTSWFTFVVLASAVSVLWAVVLFQRVLLLRQLRRVSRANLAGVLSLAPDDERANLRRAVEADAPLPDDGALARFGYPHALRRSAQHIHWLVAGTILVVLWQATVSANQSARWLSVGLAMLGVALLFARRSRERELSSILEVSPFGIALIDAQGGRHAVVWRNLPWMRVQKRRGSVALQDVSQRTLVRLDLDRVESYRALELIVQYGGYRFEESAP